MNDEIIKNYIKIEQLINYIKSIKENEIIEPSVLIYETDEKDTITDAYKKFIETVEDAKNSNKNYNETKNNSHEFCQFEKGENIIICYTGDRESSSLKNYYLKVNINNKN
jgi:hypothetical protein